MPDFRPRGQRSTPIAATVFWAAYRYVARMFHGISPDGVREQEETEEQKQRLARRLEKWREMTAHWDQWDSAWNRLYRNGRVSEKQAWCIQPTDLTSVVADAAPHATWDCQRGFR
ncbi:hypothetical protein AHF37_09692 [Paragonimus kellicotti]|nr:hypothetical protein AHF37_09692 [Paragonimus kellicotti]